MPRLIGHMVARNELHRYLPDVLTWLQPVCGDDIVVFDDQSDDGTFEYLCAQHLSVRRRGDDTPSFAENEAAFRQAAWGVMETVARPGPGDWVLCVDADEFLVADDVGGSVRGQLEEEMASSRPSVTFRVREVFDVRPDGTPMVRRDGYWADMRACRLVRWRPDGVFGGPPGPRGAVPSSWINHHAIAAGVSILHFGYARPDDRDVKFRRYLGDYWHNPHHIESIRRAGWLEPWDGAAPPLRAAHK